MSAELLNNPLVTPILVVLVPGLVGYLMVVIGRRKQKTELATLHERQAAEQHAAAQRQADELAEVKHQAEIASIKHQAALDTIRQEAELAELRRQEASRTEADRLRLETTQAQQVIADALVKTTQEHRDTLAAQSKALADIAIVQDQTHAAVNSAKTALESMLADVRHELKDAETSAATAAKIAALELQGAKELARRDLDAKDQQIAMLVQQLAQSTPPGQGPATPSRLLPGQADPVPGAAAESSAFVVIPEQVLPVEKEPNVSKIIQP